VVILQLPASKTDPFRTGVSIPLSPSGDIACPVGTLRSLVQLYPRPATAPLFSQLIGPFNQKWVLGKLRQALLFAGINPAGFSSHSFHHGAANSALKAGISREDIMKMGRWKSDSVDQYFSLTSCCSPFQHNSTPSLGLQTLHPILGTHSQQILAIHMHMLWCNAKFEIGHHLQ